MKKGKLVVVALAVCTACAALYVASHSKNEDRGKAAIDAAVLEAKAAAAGGDYAGAGAILQKAIDSVDLGENRAELIAPAATLLADYAPKAAEQNAAADCVQASSFIAAAQYDQAIAVIENALSQYPDTSSTEELGRLLAEARSAKAAQRRHTLTQQTQAAEDQAQAAADRESRFRRYRDEGDTAFGDGDFIAARMAYEKALVENEDPTVRKRLADCILKTTRQRLAVADFTTTGDVGITDAGRAVAQLLLAKFGDRRYELVERSHLATLLAEQNLTMAQVVENPALLKSRKLAGVRYLALGEVVMLGRLAISARLVDVATGTIVQTAEVSAADAESLQSALDELARILQMSVAEKRAYLDDRQYRESLATARLSASEQDYAVALTAYRRCLAIRDSEDIRKEFDDVVARKVAWEKLQQTQGRKLQQVAEQLTAARSAAAANRFDEAVEHYNKALELEPDMKIVAEKELVLQKQKQAEAAAAEKLKTQKFETVLARVESALSLMPSDVPDALSDSQKALMRTALADADEALAIYPNNPRATDMKFRVKRYLEGDKYLYLDLGAGVRLKMVKIPAGTFQMGSPEAEAGRGRDESPVRWVTLTKPFYMGIYEVTQEQYQRIVGVNPSYCDEAGKDAPVENVNLDDAMAFCAGVSQLTGRGVTLPTEAQWEYACRAGSKGRFYFGDIDGLLGDYGWYQTNSGRSTHPVGSKKPNDFGLYDMHGNVSEWCLDWYDYYSAADVTDPRGPATSRARLLRGGSWDDQPNECRSAARRRYNPRQRRGYNGFRIVINDVE